MQLDLGVVQLIDRVSKNERLDLQLAALRLLFNLSFDGGCKRYICENGFLCWIVECLNFEHTQEFALKILYNLSSDSDYRSQIAYTEAPGKIIQLTINFPERLIPPEIVAVAINMANNFHSLMQFCEGTNFTALIKRAHRTFDPLLMKLIHKMLVCLSKSISRNPGEKAIHQITIRLKKSIHEIIGMCKRADSSEFLVEALGALGNMHVLGYNPKPSSNSLPIPVFTYHELVSQYKLIDFFTKLLNASQVDDDIFLHVIMIISCFAADGKAAQQFSESKLLNIVCQNVVKKIDDEEICLQSSFMIFRLLLDETAMQKICLDKSCIEILQILISDANSQINSICQQCLDIVQEYGYNIDQPESSDKLTSELNVDVQSDDWLNQIRESKFAAHNSEWIECITELLNNDDEIDFNSVTGDSPHSLARKRQFNEQVVNWQDSRSDLEETANSTWRNVHYMSDFSSDDSPAVM